MKYLFFSSLVVFSLAFIKTINNVGIQNNPKSSSNYNLKNSLKNRIKSNKMKLKIGSKFFSATLFENKTTEALKTKLPLILDMTELNSNEKYAQLLTNLPTSKEDVGTIQEGDLMLWGANTLVLFYKSFKTPYQYTKIGRIDNPNGLASAVGKGSVSVSFELD